MSAKKRIKAYFRERVGEVVTGQELQEVAQVLEWARRVREIRSEEGWEISSNNDDRSLKPGEYRLEREPPFSNQYQFARSISTRLRAEVLERNGYTCQMCGAGAGEDDLYTPGRRVRLHVGHIIDRSHGGMDTSSNLRALCSTCNQGAKNLVMEPPRWVWLLSHIRRASIDDQKRALDWLERKFGPTA